MPGYTRYACTADGCTIEVTRDEAYRGLLVRKTVSFTTFGPSPRIVKSVTTEFLCDEHKKADMDFNREANRGPGQLSAGLERVRRARQIEASRVAR